MERLKKTYWFVYDMKSKRFLWLAHNATEKEDKRRTNLIISKFTKLKLDDGRHAAILIDNGFKLHLMNKQKPTWENYANTNV